MKRGDRVHRRGGEAVAFGCGGNEDDGDGVSFATPGLERRKASQHDCDQRSNIMEDVVKATACVAWDIMVRLCTTSEKCLLLGLGSVVSPMAMMGS